MVNILEGLNHYMDFANFSEVFNFKLPLSLQALSYLSVSASSSGQLSGGSSDGSGISKSAIKERQVNSLECKLSSL